MPVINLGGDTSLCPGTTLTLATVETGTQYLWSDNSTGETLTISQPGLYWLQMSQHQCRAADTILIDMTEAVLFDLGADTILCRGETLLLDPGIETDVEYKWQDFTSGPTHIASEAGLYWLHISDPCGMTADSISVDIENCDCRLFAFIPKVNCALTSYQFSIFDRVGGLLFETNTWDMGWDGKADGKPVQVGVYVYVLRYAFEDGEMRSMYGDVTVIR
jgi:gliding motility-associated-like protein